MDPESRKPSGFTQLSMTVSAKVLFMSQHEILQSCYRILYFATRNTPYEVLLSRSSDHQGGEKTRGLNDRINIRSHNQSFLESPCLGPYNQNVGSECRILMFMWSLGPVKTLRDCNNLRSAPEGPMLSTTTQTLGLADPC